MKVLQITVHFSPNVGGVETHLLDLLEALEKKKFQSYVLCYQPLSTRIDWKVYEKDKNTTIFRLPWLAGFFDRLIPYPFLEFIYLFPGLFLATPFVILNFKPKVIHAHGIISATVAVLWGKLFNIKTVISTHSIYNFPKKGLYANLVKLIFNNASNILCLSKVSFKEIADLGISADKLTLFTYWIDLVKFKKKSGTKDILDRPDSFKVLFVGRILPEKGIRQLLNSVKKWNEKIRLFIIGSGTLDQEVIKSTQKIANLSFLGKISYDNLPLYYSAADLVIVPSIHEEGFGRVIIEALACGTPVVASNRGAISEAMDTTVGILINPTPQEIKQAVEYLFKNQRILSNLAKNARKFAIKKYSEKNAQTIIQAYTK